MTLAGTAAVEYGPLIAGALLAEEEDKKELTPEDLEKDGWKDVTHPERKKNTSDREYEKDGKRIEYHPGKEGEKGWNAKDHFHVHNPNSTGKGDYYLDANGKPCPRNSGRSHINPGKIGDLID